MSIQKEKTSLFCNKIAEKVEKSTEKGGVKILFYPINGNKVVFTDSTGWRETILGDNMIYYAPVTN